MALSRKICTFVLLMVLSDRQGKPGNMTFDLVLGTSNAKKGQELLEMLPSDLFSLRTLSEIDDAIDVQETGLTFADNARLKSTEQAKHLNCWVLAEDSGLSVSALDGAPGVYSARFSGKDATNETNNDLLLSRLEGIPLEKRNAFYTCSLSLSDPSGTERLVEVGHCHGRILMQPAGTGGFGYDPLFEIPEYHLTFGQLGRPAKEAISHRARALRSFVPRLISLIKQL